MRLTPGRFDTLWRHRSDTPAQCALRMLTRVFVPAGGLEQVVGVPEQRQGVPADGGVPFPDAGLHLATPGSLPAGRERHRERGAVPPDRRHPAGR